MTDPLAEAIASSLAEWDVPHVELAIYGSADPAHIAEWLRQACIRELHDEPRAVLFYRASLGAVAGLELASGKRVVVKAHQPAPTTRGHLTEVVQLQSMIESQLHFAPKVLAGPFEFARGYAVIEEFVDRGKMCNGHDPEVRRELARSLHAIVACCEGIAADNLRPAILLELDRPDLWPQPHSKLFDFAATRDGADDIDRIAARARSRMTPVGREIVGHSDWRAEHVRFRDGVATIGFDWDSLCKAREPALVGATAHMFCANFMLANHIQAPTLAEANAFIADYEAARGSAFDGDERRLCAATLAYAIAYTSRCGHAAGVDSRHEPGTFQHLLATEVERLLDA